MFKTTIGIALTLCLGVLGCDTTPPPRIQVSREANGLKVLHSLLLEYCEHVNKEKMEVSIKSVIAIGLRDKRFDHNRDQLSEVLDNTQFYTSSNWRQILGEGNDNVVLAVYVSKVKSQAKQIVLVQRLDGDVEEHVIHLSKLQQIMDKLQDGELVLFDVF
jgi:hypothetical protein